MKSEQRLNEEKTAQGHDRVSHFNWTMRNSPGEFHISPFICRSGVSADRRHLFFVVSS